MDPVALRESSQRWLETGLAAFSRGDDSNDFAVHHAGVALEHLLKAYLASLHPALVAEMTDWDSLLHATGHGERARVPSTRTKTIGLKAAFDRVKKLIPTITVSDAEFKPVSGYDLIRLRTDLDRFTFLLGGDNGDLIFPI